MLRINKLYLVVTFLALVFLAPQRNMASDTDPAGAGGPGGGAGIGAGARVDGKTASGGDDTASGVVGVVARSGESTKSEIHGTIEDGAIALFKVLQAKLDAQKKEFAELMVERDSAVHRAQEKIDSTIRALGAEIDSWITENMGPGKWIHNDILLHTRVDGNCYSMHYGCSCERSSDYFHQYFRKKF